jgi:hypothetical protein
MSRMSRLTLRAPSGAPDRRPFDLVKHNNEE